MLKEQGVEQLAIAVGARQADIVFALKIGGVSVACAASGWPAGSTQTSFSVSSGCVRCPRGMQGLRQAKVMALGGEPLSSSGDSGRSAG